MVVEKMEGLFYSGRLLYINNYYNSIKLAHNLINKALFVHLSALIVQGL